MTIMQNIVARQLLLFYVIAKLIWVMIKFFLIGDLSDENKKKVCYIKKNSRF